MKRKHLILALAFVLAVSPALAVDSILLKNGTRLSGTIIAQSKDQVIMKVGEGTAVFQKRAIRRIYDDITSMPPVVDIMETGSLPPWWVPLADLYSEDWVSALESVPATAIESGKLQNVPYLSFRANDSYELNIYGDPEDPAAIEIGYYDRSPNQAVMSNCREFIVSYLTTLPQIRTLYELDRRGGSKLVDGLVIQITPPDAPDAYNGWWVLVYDPDAIKAARLPSLAAFEEASRRNLTRITAATDGETEWTKWNAVEALERLVPMERTEER